MQSVGYTHLANTKVSTLSANVNNLGALASHEEINQAARNKADDFLAAMNPRLTDKGAIINGVDNFAANSAAFAPNLDMQLRTQSNFALFLKNSEALVINNINATAALAPHIYVETTAAKNLTIAGQVITTNTQTVGVGSGTEGVQILIAGGKLAFGPSGSLVTQTNFVGGVRTQVIEQIGLEGDYVQVTGYDGGQGFLNTQPVSSRIVDSDLVLSSEANTSPDSDAYQRVVLNHGFAGEAGFDVYIAYADSFVQRFNNASDIGVIDDRAFFSNPVRTLNADSYDAAPNGGPVNAFTRTTRFDGNFLKQNQSLPTVVTVRRADDFFLFENASENNGAAIKDAAVERVEIKNVGSNGAKQGGGELPVDPPPVIPPTFNVDQTPLIAQLNLLPQPELELPTVLERKVEVAVYSVYFNDKDEDGYADDTELPQSEEVIEATVIEKTSASDELELKERTRIKEKTLSSGSESPTSQELEQLKADFINDPTQETGAYAIVEKGVMARKRYSKYSLCVMKIHKMKQTTRRSR